MLNISYEKYENITGNIKELVHIVDINSAWLARVHALPEWQEVNVKFQAAKEAFAEAMEQKS